ncbi:MAG: ribosome assembly factor SBDS [Candidatus Heimdallarchaeota archaeon]|nr:ribosome assembly factor SBDS [Candidatus Heimdallarchaeota archaeon]MCK4955101.1 ribosome assembly factor SBDS [Candidatus Heimdallarchaeota archaeon]
MSKDFRGVTIDRRIDLKGKSIVRYEKHGRRYEMLVNPQPAWMFIQGEEVEIDDIFEVYDIYENISRGVKATQDDVDVAFENMTDREMAIKILRDGKLQLTADQRNEILKEKRAEIVDFIHIHCINPRENTPIPKDRIDKAIIDLGVNISYKEEAKNQALEIIDLLKPVMPIRLESIKLAIKIPPTYTGSLYGYVISAGNLIQEEWLTDGSLAVLIQIPSGTQADFLEQITSRTKGKAQVKVLERLSE